MQKYGYGSHKMGLNHDDYWHFRMGGIYPRCIRTVYYWIMLERSTDRQVEVGSLSVYPCLSHLFTDVW